MPTLKEIVAGLARLATAQKQAVALLSHQQRGLLRSSPYSPLYGSPEMTRALNSAALAGSLVMRNLEWIRITYSAGTSYGLSRTVLSPSDSSLQHNLPHRSFQRYQVKRGLAPQKNVPANNDDNNDDATRGNIASYDTKKVDAGDNSNNNDKDYHTDIDIRKADSSFLVRKSVTSSPEDLHISQKAVIVPFPNVALLLHNSLLSRYQKRRRDLLHSSMLATADPFLRVVKHAAKTVTTTTTATTRKTPTIETFLEQGKYPAKSEREFPFLLSSAVASLQANTIAGRMTAGAPLQNKRAKEPGSLKKTLEKTSADIRENKAQPAVHIEKAGKIRVDSGSFSTRASALEEMLALSKAMQLMIAGAFASKLEPAVSSGNLRLPTTAPGRSKAISRSSLHLSPSSSFSSSSPSPSPSNYPSYSDSYRGILPLHRYTSSDAFVQAEILPVASGQVPSEKARRAFPTSDSILHSKEAMKKEESRASRAGVLSGRLPVSTTVSRMLATIANAAAARSYAVDTTSNLLPPAALLQKALLYRMPVNSAFSSNSLSHSKRLSSLAGRLSDNNNPTGQQHSPKDSPKTITNPRRSGADHTNMAIPNASSSPLRGDGFSIIEEWHMRHIAIPSALYSSVSVALVRTKQAIIQGAKLAYGKDVRSSTTNLSSQSQASSYYLSFNRSSRKASSIEQRIRDNERYLPTSSVQSMQRITNNAGEQNANSSQRQEIGSPPSPPAPSSLDGRRHSDKDHLYPDTDGAKVSKHNEPPARSIVATLQATYGKYTLENMLQKKAPRSSSVGRGTALLTALAEGSISPYSSSSSYSLLSGADRRHAQRNRKNPPINPRKMQDSSVDLPLFSQQMVAIFASNSPLKIIRDTAFASATAMSAQQIVSSPVPMQTVVKRSTRGLYSNSFAGEMGMSAAHISSRYEQSFTRAHLSRNASEWNNNNNNNHGRSERSSPFPDKNVRYGNAGKELSLRTLRKMMEQIFQDELKRYGL